MSNRGPRVSVIIAAYNHAPYVRECIESVLAQTWQDFEIIITDDGSDDGTPDIVRAISDPRIDLRVFPENRGACVALNECLRRAHGEFVAVLNSDDFFMPEKLARQVAFLDIHPEVGAVFSYTQPVGESGAPFKNPQHFYYNIFNVPNRTRPEWLKHFFFFGNCLCHPSILIRRLCYDEVGLYDERLAQLPDFDMWIRLSSQFDISVLPERLVAFRIREGESNASGMRSEVLVRSHMEWHWILRHYLELEECLFQQTFKEDLVRANIPQDKPRPLALAKLAFLSQFPCHHQFALDLLFDFLRPNGDAQVNLSYAEFIRLTASHDVHGILGCNERDRQIARLNQTVAERDGQLARLNQVVAERDGQFASLAQTVAERNAALASVHASTSWRLTALYRWVGHQAKRARHLWRITPNIAARSGGLWDACAKATRVYRREGLVGIKHWLKQVQATSQPVDDVSSRAVGNNDDDENLTHRQGHEYRSGQKLLQHRFQQSRPLSVFRVPGLSDQRINLVTDSVNTGSLFGGVATAIILAAQLAEARQARLRIITRNERAQESNIGHILDQNGLSLSREMEFLFAPVTDDSVEVDVGDGDFFLTTSWWTTRSIMACVRNERILYLLQEDERMFYPYGDNRLRCEQTLRDEGIRFVVNTRLLFEHLLTEGFDNIRERGTWFEPAFPKNVFYPERKPSNGKRKCFFYARPNNPRNLFYLGVEVIEEAILRGVIDLREWDVLFVGKEVPTLSLGDGYQPQVQENLSWVDYAALVRRVDLGLCLMYSPHPSYPPLDLVASGAVAVTNRYGLKGDLSAYSRNLVCAALDRESLVQGIETGVRLALDTDTREANYRDSGLCHDWRQALSEVVGQYAEEDR